MKASANIELSGAIFDLSGIAGSLRALAEMLEIKSFQDIKDREALKNRLNSLALQVEEIRKRFEEVLEEVWSDSR